MDGRLFPLGGAPHSGGATATATALPERPAQTSALPPVAEVPSSRGLERLSTSNLRAAFRPGINTPQNTVRSVTPEPADVSLDILDRNSSGVPLLPRGFGSRSPQTSPRSIPSAGGASGPPPLPARRQGLVFNDALAGSFDSISTSPAPRQPSFRPRTHTMDGAFRQQLPPTLETRHRVGSFSSSGSLPVTDDLRLPPLQPPFESYRPPDLQIPASQPTPKDRKSSARSRLTKRPSSRPSSPLSSPPPSVDSLPLPIPTSDANKVLLLMKNLCGKMRGEVEYQREPGGLWRGGICYIEDERGSLMFDSGENGPFHTSLIPDLRGCRVLPTSRPGNDRRCLEISSPQLSMSLRLRPLVAEEMDLWLAALLCWQQLRPAPAKRMGNGTSLPARPEMRHRSSSSGFREVAIIKVGKVMLWDKGAATSPRAIVKRPSTRDLRSSQTSWRKVSCILQDNGELKLMTENDVSVLSVIELSQLARSAIQQLDKSVLDEDYCLAIFPIYSSTSTQLSIFRPVYISLESRVLFEVWFVLLRAFTIPDVYSFDSAIGGQVYEVTNLNEEPTGEAFRIEKSIAVRVTEAKIRGRTMTLEGTSAERHGKSAGQEFDVGNYLAEIILDGEVRTRTTTKTATNNPFWREECVFTDLPSTLPYLSVLLKRVEGNPEGFSHQLQATLGLPKTGNLTEVLCGSVDIPLHQLDRGKDHEQWFHIYDDKQASVGTMFVKVHHEELVVLFSRNYKPLSELLHRFSSGLTAQITQALPGSLRRVAEILINIFQVSESTTEWLMNMVEDEIDGIGNQAVMKKPRFSQRLKSNESIDSTSDREQIVRDMGKSLQGEANLLFRGNSLLTQAMEFHMHRLGKEYLEETLAAKINEINEMDPDCEVDPSKIQSADSMQQHWNLLIQLITEIWECITASAARIPPEIRHILKYVRAVAEDRYGDFLRTVTYTSVSGFLFLRFLCPAILNPKLFGLLRDYPRPSAQRTLTLIAKGLQALANLSTIGKKETWMEPMNRFLSTQRQAFKDFLDEVCAIPVERTNMILPASYSTPITILGRLSPVAREGFPSLPHLVDHARNFAALVKLWAEAHPVSASASQVYEGDLLEFHTLCLMLHQRAMECFAQVEIQRTADTASQATEDHLSVTDAMDRVHLGDPLNTLSSSQNGSAVWMDGEGRAPGSSGSEMEASTPPLTSANREMRQRRRESSALRQVSKGSEASSQGGSGGTVRGLRNGMHPRKFLSGFIRKTRTASPDHLATTTGTAASNSPVVVGKERDRDRERERDSDREKEKGWERERDGEHIKVRKQAPDFVGVGLLAG
ncbi:hypothetical protein B0H66DRAFT_478097 [Apodospora peruviana]|uniref:Ras-GAP domain-containing protein n=1 Tax=Apodospora peruviana TaxID=516989 RepID=A0AAE0I1P6_9PEZI|nr:hypothetical protein B0H66DRAFT_478097 [Apodospora peruviana]